MNTTYMTHTLNYILTAVLVLLSMGAESRHADSPKNNVTLAGYDLTVLTASMGQVIYRGGDATVNYTIGNIDTDNFNIGVEVKLTLASRVDQSYIRNLGTRTVSNPISSGGFVNATTEPITFFSTYVGDYYVKIEIDPNGLLTESNASNNTYFLPITIYEGDLFFNSTSFPDLITPNKSFQIGHNLGYVGSGADMINQVKCYLSTDNLLDGGDVFLDQIPSSFSSEQFYDLTAPATVMVGQTYYLIVKVDPNDLAIEPNEANNIVVHQVTAVDPYVDLEPTITSFSTILKSGRNEQLNFDLKNNGNKDYNGTINLRYYLSEDATFSPALDQLVLEDNSPTSYTILAGQQIGLVEHITIPVDWIADPTYVFVVVDEANTIAESKDNNNIVVISAPMLYANLQIGNLSVNGQALLGEAFNVDYTVIAELYGARADLTEVAFYLSTNRNYDEFDTFIQSVSVAKADLGTLQTTSITINDVPPNNYYLFAIVDPNNLIPEEDEIDNNQVYITLNLGLPMKPDLTITNVVAPTWAWPGQTVNASFRIANIGTNWADGEYHILLSLDTVVSTDDVSILNDLASGRLYENDFQDIAVSITIPSGITFGSYNLLFVADKDNYVNEIYEQNNTVVHPIIIEKGVDLVILSGNVTQTNINPGDNINAGMEITNEGTRTLVDLTINYYLSQDRILDGGDGLVLSVIKDFINIDPGFTTSVGNTINIPSGISSFYLNYLIVELKPADYNTSNSIKVIPINAPKLPDIEILSISTFDPGISPGENGIVVSAEVRNTGDNYFFPEIDFYLSPDTLFDSGTDLLLANSGISLSIGETNTITEGFIGIPNSFTTGSYYLMAVVDPNSVALEIDETNNVFWNPVEVRYPDMSISVSNPPTVAGPGQIFSVAALLNGNIDVTFRYVLSSDEVYDVSDIVLGTYPINSSTVDVGFPNTLTAGNFFFLAIIDPDNMYDEFDETNNVVAYPIIINDQLAADLTVSNLSLDISTQVAGEDVTATFDIQNIGSIQYPGGFYVKIYASRDNLIDGSDNLLYEDIFPCPLPGGSRTYNTIITLPATLSAEPYNILVVVDPNDQVFEISESNNLGIAPLSVVYPDLNPYIDIQGVGTPQFAPRSIMNLTIGANCLGCNIDYAIYPPLNYEIYLSQDMVQGASDFLISSGVIPLEVGSGNLSMFLDITAPVNYPAGQYYLLYNIDPNNTIPEMDEVNNRANAAFEIQNIDYSPTSLNVRYDHIRPGGKFFFDYNIFSQQGGTSGRNVVLLSVDATPDPSDRIIFESTEQDYRSYGGDIMPVDIVPGNYNLIVVSDYYDEVGETNENNNVGIPLPIVVEKIDIAFSASSDDEIDSKVYIQFSNHTNISPFGRFAIGKCGKVNYRMTNQSQILFENEKTEPPTSQYVNKIYFSLDATLDPADILLDEVGFANNLTPDGSNSISSSFNFNVPDVAPGFYYLIVETDAQDMYDETDETNNTLALLVELRYLDFYLSYLPEDHYLGQPYTLPYQFRPTPQTTCRIPTVTVDYYISSTGVLDGNAILLGSFNKIADNITENLQITFPDNLLAGDYFMIFDIDPDNLVFEGDETNNTTSKPFTVFELDFAAVIQPMPATLSPGQSLNVSIDITSAASKSFPVKVVYNLGTSEVINAINSIYTGETVVNAPGVTSFTVQIPDDIFYGTYHLNALVDPDNAYVESNKKNNFDSKSILIDGFDTYVDPPMNYITSYGLDETGVRIAGQRVYFDLSGIPLQSQTKNYQSGQVHISQQLYDRYRRLVGNTMAAPANQETFAYRDDFVLAEDGLPYDYNDFDLAPVVDPVGSAYFGTLGWYYSTNNTVEENVPASGFPYSQMEYYDDGTGDVKRSAGPGEEFKIGSGHEVYSRIFGVTTELDTYVTIRNKIFNIIGGTTTLAGEAIQSFSIDQNGNKAVSFADRNENVLMSAQAESTATSLEQLPTYSLGDISYNFYNNAGRLVVSIAPNGVKMILESLNGIDDFDVNALPYATYYTYNHQGWLLSTTETDAGMSEYIYRKDGSIRFSQNAEQREKSIGLDSYFSYTDYDQLGRPIESGEYERFWDDLDPVDFGSLEMEGLLGLTGFNNFGASKRDWVKTTYDEAAGSILNLPTEYVQEFVMGAVSSTSNANITTWYSYDEQGRVTWMAQNPTLLPDKTFLVEYQYDFLGNVLQVGYKAYSGGSASDAFYHYYTYDADKRLSAAYTSLDDIVPAVVATSPEAQIQAKYDYYLHGPLKRIELGDKLQGIDFVYNINGWLKQINNPDNLSDKDGTNDAFALLLNYYQTNMLSLFQPVQLSSSFDINGFHGLPNSFQNEQTDIASMMNLYKPFVPVVEVQNPLKEQSAEKQINEEKFLKLKEDLETKKEKKGIGALYIKKEIPDTYTRLGLLSASNNPGIKNQDPLSFINKTANKS
jgi:subtilase family serine protease